MKLTDAQKQILSDGRKRQIVLAHYNWCAAHSLIWRGLIEVSKRDYRKAVLTKAGVAAL